MKRTTLISFAAGSIATAGLAFLIAAGPEHKHHDSHDGMDKVTEPEMNEMMEMSEAEIMAAMMKISTPNEHHAKLSESVGEWTAHASFIMDPTQPPMESEGSMTVTSVLGGRYIMSEFKMHFMGQPFEGLGLHGYDIAHEQYISTWADTMSTKILYMTGNEDDDGNMIMLGTATTPMGDNPMKIVSKHHEDGTWSDKFFDQMPDGSWYNSGTITYTRK